MVGNPATFKMISWLDDADLDLQQLVAIKKKQKIQYLVAANSDINDEKKNRLEDFP